MTPRSPVAHYRFTAKLGQGGMGEVWRATDTKLQREVAIKLLPEKFAQDPDRMARFEREARVLAALNHPNIAAIYGVENRALVMELVEGITLADRIAQGAVPVEEARPIIDQLVDALAYAHEKGVIHRDLKPANIKLTPEGRVKILDFGLAKAVTEEPSLADPASSPTLTMRATLAGVIMGTAAYMAPEQARGHEVDGRADIWSFGVVVYEMLTGRHLFAGPTVSDTLASVLKEVPNFDSVPRQMRWLLRHCLEKDPQRRMQAIGDARILLAESPVAATPAAPVARGRLVVLWCVMLILLISTGVLGYRLWRVTRPVSRPLTWLSVDLGPDAVAGRDFTAAISPDGTTLVFPISNDGVTRLAVRSLAQPTATVLPGTENAFDPFFSPDGEWVAFGAAGKLKKISIHGGLPVSLCDGGFRGGSWGEDGYIIAALGNSGGLSRVPDGGGAPQPLTKLEGNELTHRWPQVLPGGEAVLFSVNAAQNNWDQANVVLLSLKTGRRKMVVRGGFFGRYLPGGYLVYLRGGSLYAVRFNIDAVETKGPPVTLLEDVASSIFGGGQFDFSRTGTLVYLGGRAPEPKRALEWIDANGKTRPFFATANSFAAPALSPDGKRLAAVTTSDGSSLWVYDLDREIPTRLPSASNVLGAIWAPDGKHLLYGTAPGASTALMWIRADGSAEPQVLKKGDNQNPMVPHYLSADGRLAIYLQPISGSSSSWSIAIDQSDPEHPRAGEPQPLGQARMSGAAVSRDAHWLAYYSGQSGIPEVFVRPFSEGKVTGEAWQISAGGGAYPLWSKSRNELFYQTPEGRVMVVAYAADGKTFRPSKPRIWSTRRIGYSVVPGTSFFNSASRPYDITPDGDTIISWEADDQPKENKVDLHVNVLQNWFDELDRRLGPER